MDDHVQRHYSGGTACDLTGVCACFVSCLFVCGLAVRMHILCACVCSVRVCQCAVRCCADVW